MPKKYDYSKKLKMDYEWYKAHGICVECRKREEMENEKTVSIDD